MALVAGAATHSKRWSLALVFSPEPAANSQVLFRCSSDCTDQRIEPKSSDMPSITNRTACRAVPHLQTGGISNLNQRPTTCSRIGKLQFRVLGGSGVPC